MNKSLKQIVCALAVMASFADHNPVNAQDPLASWKDGPAKQVILDFVHATTEKASPAFVPPEQRIATFDNDGTLWVEQPIYTQIMFAIDRVTALAPQHPDWNNEDPFKAILAHDAEKMSHFTTSDIEKIVGVTHSGMTVEVFGGIVKDWLATARHPVLNRPYTELVYQPMLEVMRYLRASGFKTYIVTGGGQDFVRAFAETVYGVPPEQVVGSASKVRYGYDKDGLPMLVKLPAVLLIDDKAGKPEDIHLMIGRRPYAAFGNSEGDRQMLEYTKAGDGARLSMLVHHDDAQREFAYDKDSKVGTFPPSLAIEAQKRGWIIISMKNDWKRIFAWQQ